MLNTVKGFAVIRQHATKSNRCERAGTLVLLDCGAAYGERYVVAWVPIGQEREYWTESAYYESRAGANEDFDARVACERRRGR